MDERASTRGIDAPAIRVVLVDDHTMVRQGVRQSLLERGIDVIGEASNGVAGVRLVRELRPDVVVMDLHMPQMDGIQATRAIVEEDPDARVLMLTISTDEDDVIEALTIGACGYVLKTGAPDDIAQAVRAARAGESAVSPVVAGRVVERLRAARKPSSAAPAPAVTLTPREMDILRLVVEGRDNAEIAEMLVISPSTAKNHVARVLDKLGVDNRVQAAVYAVRAGLV